MYILLILCLCILTPWMAEAMRDDYLRQLRQETVDMFYHGFNNYMDHAFPEDELRPLTCSSLTRDRDDPTRIGLNDALGNYSLTLIDSLSTLAILAGGPKDEAYTAPQALSDFQDGVTKFVEYYGDGRTGQTGQGIRSFGFDLDSKVQVFETVIRGVGGLLSAHLFAIGELPMAGYAPSPVTAAKGNDPLELPPILWPNGFKYDGQLLRLALDLGQRLLPAFYTSTGIPYPRVNLRHGIPFYVNSPLHNFSDDDRPEDNREITETCSAGAGSLTLEFTVLSRLSGDPRFEQAAKRAFWEVWGRRSEIGLIGNGIDAERGLWIGPHSGIGAGIDSFFEYSFKSHVLLSGHDAPNISTSHRQSGTNWLDPNSIHAPLASELQSSEAFLDAWHQAHASVKRHIYTDRNHFPYYSNNHRATGQPYTMWIDSLAAFYPGLLALAGEVEEAIEGNLFYTALWTRYSALPERWSFRENNIDSGIGWWPGRPEFIESTYYIYRATKDPWYLYVGEMVLKDIKWRCHAPCGWAGLQDVRTGEKQDRMESFFLGETAKYMYLLFDPEHALNKLDAPFVFSTEGHPLIIPRKKYSTSRPAKRPVTEEKGVVTTKNSDANYTITCPVPPKAGSLFGSATAARPDLFAASLFTDLHNTPNLHGPLEAVEVEDKKKGRRLVKYRPLSNHTIFPWTLPPVSIGDNGTCSAPLERVITWIEFPTTDAFSSVVSRLGNSIVRLSNQGPTVKNLEGMRLQLIREEEETTGNHVWRIAQVGVTQLGRDESVFFHAEHVRHLKDDAFTVLRRTNVVDIELIVDSREAENASIALPDGDGIDTQPNPASRRLAESALASDSLIKSLFRSLSSVFEPAHTGTPKLPNLGAAGDSLVYTFSAYTPVGRGAFPVPSVVDTPVVNGPNFNAHDPLANFPWRTVFLAGHACDGPLPDHVARQHTVIVMRRGRCTFSTKVDNIPSYTPTSTSLQLLIVVDEDEYAEPSRPSLETEQLTPKGIKRLHGVPMVLLSGAPGDYNLFSKAKGVGMRRKYVVQSQGLPVENAVIL
ncbi:hypothetical protein V2G26_011622 [Clonostachys chloroleuca]